MGNVMVEGCKPQEGPERWLSTRGSVEALSSKTATEVIESV